MAAPIDAKAHELIDVRLDIDVDKLLPYLRQHSAFPAGNASVKQFNRGASNPTYLIEDSAGGRWVLRKKPPGKLLKTAHQVDREYRILTALQKTDVPVPRTLCFCEDASVIGTPFYVMEFVNGRVIEDVTLKRETPENRAQIYWSLLETMAKIHRVSYQAVGLEGYGKPTGWVQRQINTWRRNYEQDRELVRNRAVWEKKGITWIDNGDFMDRLLAYLSENVDKELALMGEEKVSIVHGDYSIPNVILHPTEPRIVAVLDWELSTLGNPIADLSYVAMNWYLPSFVAGGSQQPVDNMPFIPTEAQFVKRYCELMGMPQIPDSVWRFMKAFHIFRRLAINHGVFARGLQGNNSSNKAAKYGFNAWPAKYALEKVLGLGDGGARPGSRL